MMHNFKLSCGIVKILTGHLFLMQSYCLSEIITAGQQHSPSNVISMLRHEDQLDVLIFHVKRSLLFIFSYEISLFSFSCFSLLRTAAGPALVQFTVRDDGLHHCVICKDVYPYWTKKKSNSFIHSFWPSEFELCVLLHPITLLCVVMVTELSRITMVTLQAFSSPFLYSLSLYFTFSPFFFLLIPSFFLSILFLFSSFHSFIPPVSFVFLVLIYISFLQMHVHSWPGGITSLHQWAWPIGLPEPCLEILIG